jgi:hypothetical protein
MVPYDSAIPFLERMGIKENLGWNINLLILIRTAGCFSTYHFPGVEDQLAVFKRTI